MSSFNQNMEETPCIKEYYAGKTVFITGGSGFMGKVLIEKLLYSCTDLERIYLLLRNKKGVDPEQRLSKLYNSVCFDRLRKEKPGVFESKVFFIAGDVSEVGLGISDEDRALLINNVNIIFHVAASVRFNDKFDYAIKLNLRGTKYMVDLAHDVLNLECFVHVSTCFSNTNRERIEETMYPAHASWQDTLDICENTDFQILDILTSKYTEPLPNTYVFTKQLAEHVIYEQRGKLPVVLIRPSVVISAEKEPFPGWNENFNGPNAILVVAGKGLLRTVYGDPDLVQDYIPVDVAIKHFIVAAWKRGIKKLESTDDLPTYNCCSAGRIQLSLKRIGELGLKVIEEVPFDNNIWGSNNHITNSKYVYYCSVIFNHLIPAIILDTLLILIGKKPRLIKIQRRIYNTFIALQYFTTQKWTFTNDNFIHLRSTIKTCDEQDFFYDVENINYFKHMVDSAAVIRKYSLHEKDEDIPRAKLNYRMKLDDTIDNFAGSLPKYRRFLIPEEGKWAYSSQILKDLEDALRTLSP